MQRYMLWAPCTQSAVSMEKVEVIPSFKGNIVVQGCRKLRGQGEFGYHHPRFWQIYLYRHSSIYAVNMGTQKKNRGSKNRVNRGYLVVLKGRKIG